jgi:hypothetical protein
LPDLERTTVSLVKKELRLVLLAREKKICINSQGMSCTVPCFKEIRGKYLTVLRRSKMYLVLRFELILKIGSTKCAYGGR